MYIIMQLLLMDVYIYLLHRVVNTYQRRRNSPSLNTNPSDARIGQGYMPQPIQSSFSNNCRPTTEGK